MKKNEEERWRKERERERERGRAYKCFYFLEYQISTGGFQIR